MDRMKLFSPFTCVSTFTIVCSCAHTHVPKKETCNSLTVSQVFHFLHSLSLAILCFLFFATLVSQLGGFSTFKGEKKLAGFLLLFVVSPFSFSFQKKMGKYRGVVSIVQEKSEALIANTRESNKLSYIERQVVLQFFLLFNSGVV